MKLLSNFINRNTSTLQSRKHSVRNIVFHMNWYSQKWQKWKAFLIFGGINYLALHFCRIFMIKLSDSQGISPILLGIRAFTKLCTLTEILCMVTTERNLGAFASLAVSTYQEPVRGHWLQVWPRWARHSWHLELLLIDWFTIISIYMPPFYLHLCVNGSLALCWYW